MGFKILAQTSAILTAQTHVKFPLPAFPLSASAKSSNMALHDTEVQSSRQSSDKGNKILSCSSSSPTPEALCNPAVPSPLLPCEPTALHSSCSAPRSHHIDSWRGDHASFTRPPQQHSAELTPQLHGTEEIKNLTQVIP